MMNAITKENVYKMVEEIKRLMLDTEVKKRQLSLQPLWPLGIPVIESPHIQDLEPVIKLSEKVIVSDKFRKECNQLYIDMFGYKEPQIFRTQYGLIVGPKLKNILTVGAIA